MKTQLFEKRVTKSKMAHDPSSLRPTEVVDQAADDVDIDSSYASPDFADPPFKDEDWFIIDRRLVSDVVTPLVQANDNAGLSAVLISGLFTPSYHGFLSKLHTKLEYTHGLAHPLTTEVRLLIPRDARS